MNNEESTDFFIPDGIDNLKLSLSDENLADMLISKYDYLDSCISNEKFDAALCSNLVLLLKFILENGPHLDEDVNHREQMDMFFTLFRNILRNYLRYLPESINLLILRLIEIRASKWKIKQGVEEYYMKKVKPNNGNEKPSIRMSKFFGDIITSNSNTPSDNESYRNSRLLKGNIKGVYKDEMLIKNSDSGKVMGIKGRRVHMIEEMSDTIISFQKVSPSAKDRLVLITGHNRENIEKAKNLIDVTIRQNVSPIPFETTENSYNSVDDSSLNDEDYFQTNSNDLTEPHSSSLLQTFSTNGNQDSDCLPREYTIPIPLGDKEVFIKISDQIIGQKLEYFLEKFKFSEFVSSSGSYKESENIDKKKSKYETSTLKSSPKITYDREFLMSLNVDSIKSILNPRLIDDIKQKQHNLFRE